MTHNHTIYFNPSTNEKINIFPDFLLATSGIYSSNFKTAEEKEETFYFKGGAAEQAEFVQNLINEGFRSVSVN